MCKAVTQEEARAILQAGGEPALAFATKFSQRMKSDLLDRAIEDPAKLKGIIGTACDAAVASPVAPLPPPQPKPESKDWGAPPINR